MVIHRSLMVLAATCFMAGCGGGGGDGPSGAPSNATTQLEGTWVHASDGRRTGGACGLDVHGKHGTRLTLQFSGSQYTAKQESCVILTGNTGSYITTNSGGGAFAIGDVVATSADPALQRRALDLHVSPVFYTSYSLSGASLKVAIPYQTFDGSTPEKRAFQTGSFYDAASRTLIETPVYTKM